MEPTRFDTFGRAENGCFRAVGLRPQVGAFFNGSFGCGNVHREYDRLPARGVKFVGPPVSKPFGMSTFRTRTGTRSCCPAAKPPSIRTDTNASHGGLTDGLKDTDRTTHSIEITRYLNSTFGRAGNFSYKSAMRERLTSASDRSAAALRSEADIKAEFLKLAEDSKTKPGRWSYRTTQAFAISEANLITAAPPRHPRLGSGDRRRGRVLQNVAAEFSHLYSA